jgi:hypothetical protein
MLAGTTKSMPAFVNTRVCNRQESYYGVHWQRTQLLASMLTLNVHAGLQAIIAVYDEKLEADNAHRSPADKASDGRGFCCWLIMCHGSCVVCW